MEPELHEAKKARPMSPLEQANYSSLNLAFVVAIVIGVIATLALVATKYGKYFS